MVRWKTKLIIPFETNVLVEYEEVLRLDLETQLLICEPMILGLAHTCVRYILICQGRCHSKKKPN